MKRLFWKIWYWLTPEPKDINEYLSMIVRTSVTNSFEPYIYYNLYGKQWEIYVSNEIDYVKRGTIKAEIHIGRESGNIVGLTIFEENLNKQYNQLKS